MLSFKKVLSVIFAVSLLTASTWILPNARAQSSSSTTSTSFADTCYTYGFYGLDDDYIVEIQDVATKTRSSRCSADSWQITANGSSNYPDNMIGPATQEPQQVKFKRLQGGSIGVVAMKNGVRTPDSIFDVKRGESYVEPSIPPTSTSPAPTTTVPSNARNVFLTIDSLKPVGVQSVMSYYSSRDGRQENDLVFTLSIKNTGTTTFDPTEPDPLNPGVITAKNPWTGYVACGTVINPVTQEFEGLVYPPNLSAGQEAQGKAYLSKGEALMGRIQKGEVLPCQIYPVNYNIPNNTQPLTASSKGNEFDLYYNGATDMPEITNFRGLNEKRTSTLDNIETGKRKDSSQPITTKIVPPAGYEDEVITTFDNYTNPFPDTNNSSLEGKAASELYRRAVIGGFPDGEFKGDRPVNRAEAAKFLLLAKGVTDISEPSSSKFPDIKPGEWYTKYTEKAASLGIIKGYDDGKFRPGNQVNVAEFLKMLNLTFGLELNLPNTYTDVQDSSVWYWQYVGAAQKYNLFPNRTNKLNPNDPLTRNEVAVAIYQYLLNRNK